jgi:predicted neuraminidase
MAHCSTLAVLPDGSLLAAWFSAAFETSRDQVILAARKSRHGEWSSPWTIASAPDYAVGQPVVLPRPNGELWLFFVVIADPEPPPVEPDFDMLPPSTAWDSAQPYLQRSYDWGVSWDPPEHVLDYPGLMFRSRPLVLPGRIVVPVYDERTWYSMMLISDDDGRSWWLTEPIVSSPGNIHACLAPLSDGRLLAYMRTGGKGGHIWRSESTDQGASWTRPRPTALPNPNSGIDLLRLQSGRLLLAFNNNSTARTPLCVALAEKGEMWQWQQTFEDEEAEFSYPTLLQTDDGLIHLVYTYRREHIHYACFTETWLRKVKINVS